MAAAISIVPPSRRQTVSALLRDFVDRVFSGSARPLSFTSRVTAGVKADLEALRQMLDEAPMIAADERAGG